MLSAADVEASPALSVSGDSSPGLIWLDSHASLSKTKFKQLLTEIKEERDLSNPPKHHDPFTYTAGIPHESLHISDKIYHFLHNKYVHMIFSILLLIDIAIVITSIYLEIQYLTTKVSDYESVLESCQEALEAGGQPAECEDNDLGQERFIEVVEKLAIFSLSILSLFLLESVILLTVNPRHFLSTPIYVLDLFVVVFSIVLEVVFRNEPQGGLLIIARIWRFARIGHGIFEESKPEQNQAALIRSIVRLDRNKSITKAFLANESEGQQSDDRHYILDSDVIDELIGTVGAFLTEE